MNETLSKNSGEEGIAKLAKLISGIRFAMLTTIDENSHLVSRPMATQDGAFDGTLWFFTQRHSHKVSELEEHAQVNLAYADPSDNRYVSVRGTARMVEDDEKKRALWSPMLKAWFPKGLDDPELGLLRVDVEDAQYWDSPNSKMVQLFGMAKAIVTGEGYKPSRGEAGRIDLGR